MTVTDLRGAQLDAQLLGLIRERVGPDKQVHGCDTDKDEQRPEHSGNCVHLALPVPAFAQRGHSGSLDCFDAIDLRGVCTARSFGSALSSARDSGSVRASCRLHLWVL